MFGSYEAVNNQFVSFIASPLCGASSISPVACKVTQSGNSEPSSNSIDVKTPIGEHMSGLQALVAGDTSYASSFNVGCGKLRVMGYPTATPMLVNSASCHKIYSQSHAGCVTSTVRSTSIASISSA